MWNIMHSANPDQTKSWNRRLTGSAGQMDRFRQCWKAQGNDRRTGMKDSGG